VASLTEKEITVLQIKTPPNFWRGLFFIEFMDYKSEASGALFFIL